MKEVEAIKDIKKIKLLRTVLRDQSLRNELLFVLGINVGLRISDLIQLRFNDIFKPGLKTIKESVTIKEIKIGRNSFYKFNYY